MKIVCDKAEYAMLVRLCSACGILSHCQKCLFSPVCSCMKRPKGPEAIMMSIEDICELEKEVEANG